MSEPFNDSDIVQNDLIKQYIDFNNSMSINVDGNIMLINFKQYNEIIKKNGIKFDKIVVLLNQTLQNVISSNISKSLEFTKTYKNEFNLLTINICNEINKALSDNKLEPEEVINIVTMSVNEISDIIKNKISHLGDKTGSVVKAVFMHYVITLMLITLSILETCGIISHIDMTFILNEIYKYMLVISLTTSVVKVFSCC